MQLLFWKKSFQNLRHRHHVQFTGRAGPRERAHREKLYCAHSDRPHKQEVNLSNRKQLIKLDGKIFWLRKQNLNRKYCDARRKTLSSIWPSSSFSTAAWCLFINTHLHILNVQHWSTSFKWNHPAARTGHILQWVTNPPQNLQGLFGLIWLDLHHHYIIQPVGRGNNTAAPYEPLGLLPDWSQEISRGHRGQRGRFQRVHLGRSEQNQTVNVRREWEDGVHQQIDS